MCTDKQQVSRESTWTTHVLFKSALHKRLCTHKSLLIKCFNVHQGVNLESFIPDSTHEGSGNKIMSKIMCRN